MSAWLDVATITRISKHKGGSVAKAAAGLPFLLQPGAAVRFAPPVLDAPRGAQVAAVSGLAGDTATVRFDLPGGAVPDALVGCHCLMEADAARAIAEELGEGSLFTAAVAGFIGWALEDADGSAVGTVADCVEHPTQLTLTVELPDGEERLVPLVDELLVSLDEAARVIRMELPGGILEA